MLMPKEFRTIKQPFWSKVCCACVGVMAVGEDMDYADKHIELTPSEDGRPYIRFRHLLGFLGNHGIICGLMGTFNGEKFDPSDKFPMEFIIEDWPAIVTVKSETFKTYSHLVFWDGQHIRDPNPRKPDTTTFDDYELIDLMPLMYLDESLDP